MTKQELLARLGERVVYADRDVVVGAVGTLSGEPYCWLHDPDGVGVTMLPECAWSLIGRRALEAERTEPE